MEEVILLQVLKRGRRFCLYA